MAVKIRLKRFGKLKSPFYRVVVMDSRAKRDGRAIEEIGKYHPTAEPSLIDIDSERAQYWLGVGAQPTEQVAALLKITGDWQKFKGLPGAEGTLKVAEPRRDKRALYEAATKAAMDAPKDGATTARKKATADKAEKPETAEKPDKAESVVDAPVEAPQADQAEGVTADAPQADAQADAPQTDAQADEGGFGPDSAAPLADGAAPQGFTIKGNKDSMKYHTADSQWYEQTVAEVWFRTEDAAKAAGFVAPGADKAEA